jgi:hypothetical protein
MNQFAGRFKCSFAGKSLKILSDFSENARSIENYFLVAKSAEKSLEIPMDFSENSKPT